MAEVVLLCPDLLFGSRVVEGLRGAGHAVTSYPDQDAALLAAGTADVLVVDLTTDGYDLGALGRVRTPTLGFYSHVDVDTRRRAEAAGFDLVVPRSRMAREMADLVDRLA